LDRLYGSKEVPVQRVTHFDGSTEFVKAHSIPLKEEETSAHFAKLAEEEERQRQEEEDRAARDAAQKEVAAYKAELEAKWRKAGGLSSDFEELWPDLRKKFILEKMGLEDL
jgi:hypothetical protein